MPTSPHRQGGRGMMFYKFTLDQPGALRTRNVNSTIWRPSSTRTGLEDQQQLHGQLPWSVRSPGTAAQQAFNRTKNFPTAWSAGYSY